MILLRGAIGAGKTTLVDGFAAGMGAGRATSPSFVLAHRYAGGRLPIVHLDLFRIEDPAAIADLDLGFYVPADGVALVEWPERAGPQAWTADRVEVELFIDGQTRRAAVRGFGACADLAHAAVGDYNAALVKNPSSCSS